MTSCGSDDAGAATSPAAETSAMPSMSGTMSGDHNDQDATFASGMIVHRRGASEMAKRVSSRATDPAVVALAQEVEAAQQPEITTMTAWLQSWGMETPSEMA